MQTSLEILKAYYLYPVLVHFPIALLSLYVGFELVRFKVVTNNSWWFFVKAALVLFGTFFQLLTTISFYFFSMNIVNAKTPIQFVKIIHTYELYMIITLVVFMILSVGYKVSFIDKNLIFMNLKNTKFWNFFRGVSREILNSYVTIILAITGFFTLLVASSIGSYINYGGNIADPVTYGVMNMVMPGNQIR